QDVIVLPTALVWCDTDFNCVHQAKLDGSSPSVRWGNCSCQRATAGGGNQTFAMINSNSILQTPVNGNPGLILGSISASPVAFDGTRVYYANGGNIMRLPLAGEAEIFAATQPVVDMVCDGTTVFWTTPTGGLFSLGVDHPNDKPTDFGTKLV